MSGVMSEKQLTINKQITLCSKGKAENNSLKHRVGRREKRRSDLYSVLSVPNRALRRTELLCF